MVKVISKKLWYAKRRAWAAASAAVVTIALASTIMPAQAANSDSLYSYRLDGSSSTISNSAAANTGVDMNLTGDWSQSGIGVHFAGNTTDQQSAGYAKPASGTTINVPATKAVGAAIHFTYHAPSNAFCFSDSANISQLGFFANNTTQIKLQLSKCNVSSTQVFPQCRIAGNSTSSSVLPVTGTTALVNNTSYILSCAKSPDPVSGNASLELKLTKIDTVGGNQTYTDTFSIAPTGVLSSSQYLSVGAKYPLAAQANNTDQFVGEVGKVAICASADLAAANTCLADEVPAPASPQTDTADEIHYSYGDSADSVVFNWRGSSDTIYYGTTTSYGSQVTAQNSPMTPWDVAGPFREAHLTGLSTDTTYHYKVGQNGTDNTFKTRSTGDFTWVDVGDTKSSYCAPWAEGMQSLIAAQNANFVTHGGDIAILNECGTPATHSYFTDQEVWSRKAAFQPAWGNHEYGAPTPNAPAGTPSDSYVNYKGRSWITNAQTVPNDTPTKLTHPGCGAEINSTTNTCQGRDWGWFRNGNVVFIGYPENEGGTAWADWQTKAGNIMATAQADETVDFIVSYGHRPPYTSSTEGPNTTLRSTLEALAATYSPTTSNPDGKYILNVGHHAHSQEAFSPINGLAHIIDAAGGQGLTNWTTPVDSNSVFRSMHFGILKADYDAGEHSLTVNLVCGAEFTIVKDACTCGDTIYSTTFERQQPVVTTTVTDNEDEVLVNDQLTYDIGVTNTGNAAAAGTSVAVEIPSDVTITDAGGGSVSGQTVTYSVGSLAVNTPQNFTIQGTLASGTPSQVLTTTSTVTTTDNACSNSGSDCTDSDTTTIGTPPPTEWVTNKTVDSNITGWTGTYGPTTYVSITHDSSTGHNAAGSVKITGLTGAAAQQSGFNASPRLILNSVAGKTYTGSVWVKTSVANQKIVFRLREWNGNTLVTDNKWETIPNHTDWVQLTGTLTAAANGNQIAFTVHGNNVDAGEAIYADDFSLTSPN
jgi:uncharacterized repeat protein (TIGR01451 family)